MVQQQIMKYKVTSFQTNSRMTNIIKDLIVKIQNRMKILAFDMFAFAIYGIKVAF